MTDPSTPTESAAPPAGLAVWICFLAMCLGMFMAILDIQIVVTSLPAIAQALDIPDNRMSWVQTAYLIAEVIAIPLTGLLTRALSLRGLFLIALSTFTLASSACALATGFESLVAARIVQGFAGGCLIPLVFSSVFLMFPKSSQGAATTIAGAMAVLAPTLGPTIGGYITETYSWMWLFLVNVGPGVLAVVVVAFLAPRERGCWGVVWRIDWIAVGCLAIGLTALEITLKEGPQQGWLTAPALPLAVIFLLASLGFLVRSLRSGDPVVNLQLFGERNFAVASVISFLFGIGLFSAVYLMAMFLGLVRHHDPLAIGLVMMVTGISQLITAPAVVQLELRVDARLLTAAGLAIFSAGLAMSGWQTPTTDYEEMFWPQVVRGIGIMLCLIPPTRLALGKLDMARVPDGSALFNLMRNLGGAIGIAMTDTILWQRTPHHADAFGRKLMAGDVETAKFVGVPLDLLPPSGGAPSSQDIAMAQPLVEAAALTMATNEAWLVLAGVMAAGLLVLFAARN
ncbi:DHA2 family efflux MFS transporter permease subunit [Fodinicurvata sediminis]|uniref:DHA2 family efflux MFS transporter permease subunit n=1 Tax=Fodinicurvata sediminis TaxID=1121832 RepID=UPI00041EDF29|nr:DHA2 family efflux MFS transporter permease subunit [Fodinicurvata sediminis]